MLSGTKIGFCTVLTVSLFLTIWSDFAVANPLTDVITLHPTDTTVSVNYGPQPPGAFTILTVTGDFRVPIVDSSLYSLTAITNSISGDFGGAVWGDARPNEELLSGIEVNITAGVPSPMYSDNVNGGATTDSNTIVTSSAFNEHLTDALLTGYSLNNPQNFTTGSPYDAGGYIPVKFQISDSVEGSLVEVAPPNIPSELAFIGHLSLDVDYTLNPVGSPTSGLPQGDYAPLNVYQSQTFSQLPPSSVVSQIPSYIAVPEPTSILLITIGAATALLRRSEKIQRGYRSVTD